jgi:uncharacterized membrane protein YjjB (DUF3815 family)
MNASLLHICHQSFFGGIAATGFAVLFNCKPRNLPFYFGAGALGLATRTIGQEFGLSLAVASFFAALLLAIIDRSIRNFPSPGGSVLPLVGAIAMLPGSLAAKVFVSVFAFLRTGQSRGAEAVITTWEDLMMLIFTLAALGTALALPSLISAAKTKGEN